MAKVVQAEQRIIVERWWEKGNIVLIGASMGVLWWVLAALLRQYVVEPLACQNLTTAHACVNAIDVSGAIATVLVAVIGLLVLVRLIQPRPIVIALSSAIVLWSLGALVNGLAWWWALAAATLLYAIAYTLFHFVARMSWLVWSLVVALVIVAGVRILLAL